MCFSEMVSRSLAVRIGSMMKVSEACNNAKPSPPGSVQTVKQPAKANAAALDH